MGFFNKYPYTDFHELNLDWIISTVKELEDKINSEIYEETIKEYIDKYFNAIMMNAIYNESDESVTLYKEETSVSGDTHTYNYTTNTITIE